MGNLNFTEELNLSPCCRLISNSEIRDKWKPLQI